MVQHRCSLPLSVIASRSFRLCRFGPQLRCVTVNGSAFSVQPLSQHSPWLLTQTTVLLLVMLLLVLMLLLVATLLLPIHRFSMVVATPLLLTRCLLLLSPPRLILIPPPTLQLSLHNPRQCLMPCSRSPMRGLAGWERARLELMMLATDSTLVMMVLLVQAVTMAMMVMVMMAVAAVVAMVQQPTMCVPSASSRTVSCHTLLGAGIATISPALSTRLAAMVTDAVLSAVVNSTVSW